MERVTTRREELGHSPATLPWEEIAVFRETFLSLLHPECAAAFRRVGETVYNWAIEDQLLTVIRNRCILVTSLVFSKHGRWCAVTAGAG